MKIFENIYYQLLQNNNNGRLPKMYIGHKTTNIEHENPLLVRKLHKNGQLYFKEVKVETKMQNRIETNPTKSSNLFS